MNNRTKQCNNFSIPPPFSVRSLALALACRRTFTSRFFFFRGSSVLSIFPSPLSVEYKEDNAVVTKNTSVVVKRVPAHKSGGLLSKIKALNAAAALHSTAKYGSMNFDEKRSSMSVCFNFKCHRGNAFVCCCCGVLSVCGCVVFHPFLVFRGSKLRFFFFVFFFTYLFLQTFFSFRCLVFVFSARQPQLFSSCREKYKKNLTKTRKFTSNSHTRYYSWM